MTLSQLRNVKVHCSMKTGRLPVRLPQRPARDANHADAPSIHGPHGPCAWPVGGMMRLRVVQSVAFMAFLPD
jgi:hypothetical protein